MKILGCGLNKTGTTSLWKAVRMLGFERALHFHPERMADALTNPKFDFRCFDDVDAVFDQPAALFWFPLLQAYPKAKVILSVRNEDSWWRSIQSHFALEGVEENGKQLLGDLRRLAYGSERPNEATYRLRYRLHNGAVRAFCRNRRIPCLIADVADGDGWPELCEFLEAPIPSQPFPRLNSSSSPGPWWSEGSEMPAPAEFKIRADDEYWQIK